MPPSSVATRARIMKLPPLDANGVPLDIRGIGEQDVLLRCINHICRSSKPDGYLWSSLSAASDGRVRAIENWLIVWGQSHYPVAHTHFPPRPCAGSLGHTTGPQVLAQVVCVLVMFRDGSITCNTLRPVTTHDLQHGIPHNAVVLQVGWIQSKSDTRLAFKLGLTSRCVSPCKSSDLSAHPAAVSTRGRRRLLHTGGG